VFDTYIKKFTYLLSYLCDMITIMMNGDRCTLCLHDVTVYFLYIFVVKSITVNFGVNCPKT